MSTGIPIDPLVRGCEKHDLIVTHDVIVLCEFIWRQRMTYLLEIGRDVRKSARIPTGLEIPGLDEIPE